MHFVKQVHYNYRSRYVENGGSLAAFDTNSGIMQDTLGEAGRMQGLAYVHGVFLFKNLI